jgi:hypothetical protein
MIVLSLEAERIMSGFSDDVANAVTQPLWPNNLASQFLTQRGALIIPTRVPRKIRLSAMM